MAGAVAKRYASALFNLALARGKVESFDAQAQFLEEVFADAQVRRFFESPRIPADTKKQVAQRQLMGRVDPVMLNLVKLLVDKRRISFLRQILREFDALTDIQRGVEEVSIVSAIPLDDASREAILNEIRRFTSYEELRVSTEVDSGVLGGVKVKLGDNLVIDGTVSSKLRMLKQHLSERRNSGMGV
jgi:F-type H+-transporting ATPase subunit delta